uniref:Uncharacterized protein n=1 Tax=Siphoviridae sp. ct0106 TaxID=2825290 RepID=A0A8S5P4T5_9CAUD|nr:MAG TPA: hypothetical protein [Siphoviridae sp. ct0106]
MTRWTPGSASAEPGVLLCPPIGGAVSLPEALWWRGWYPRGRGAERRQIGLDGLSRVGRVRVCVGE